MKAKIEQEVEMPKDYSLKITKDTNFGMTKGDLRVYNEELQPIDYEDYPKITITAGEDLEKFQYGFIRVEIKESKDKEAKSYLIQVDGLMSIVYAVYAKTLNSLRKATIRQKTVRMWGIFRKLIEKFRKK